MPKRLSEANGNGGGRRRTDKKILFYTIKIIIKKIFIMQVWLGFVFDFFF